MALPVRVDRGNRTNPFDLARNEMNSLLSGIFNRGLFADLGEEGAIASARYGVDIREDRDHIYVEADLPGFRKEDVDLSIESGTLTILAERTEESTAPSATASSTTDKSAGKPGEQQASGQAAAQQQQRSEFLLRERRIQRFIRSFTLPSNVDEQNVQAKLDNGVLTITLNKREDAKPKHIAVS